MRYRVVDEDDGNGQYVQRLSDNAIVSERHMTTEEAHRLARKLEQQARPNPNQR